MLYCLKGCGIILSGLLTLGFLGCGSAALNMHTVRDELPLSNTRVAELVIGKALEDIGLPGGEGMEILCVVDGDTGARDIAQIIAREFLGRNGYSVVENNSSAPELRITVDSLCVTLISERSKQAGKRVARFARANITGIFLSTNGTRRVYRGTGTFDDSFTYKMVKALKRNEPYVSDRIEETKFSSKFKPLVIGAAITVFSWMLYSYRD